MPRLIPGRPIERETLRSFSAPSSTRATSPRRTVTPPRGRPLPSNPDREALRPLAADIDARDARGRGQLVDQHPLGIVGQFQHRHSVAGQVEVHDRLAERFGFLDLGRIGLLWQGVPDPPAAFAAASTSRSVLNSTLMAERPSRELERSVSIPSRPAIRSSMTCVILFSTMAAPAPR